MTPPADGTPRGYRPLSPQVDFAAMDLEILDSWRDDKTFLASLQRNEGGSTWTFYEGPPTANGRPGVHHVEARVFKDVFPRFKTMQGFYVERKAGWDCQGLHVEVGVEKELGLSGHAEIEAYGIAAFNDRCRESVERHVQDFEDLTERMGYWVDLDAAYRTMDPSYIQSVWWSLKQIHDKGLLVEDYRITPYCPRCGTGLSDHELGQPGAYETVLDPSVYVRLPLTSGPLAGHASLLVWTTTPWTLVSNTTVAANPAVTYVAATDGTETLVIAEPLLDVLGDGWQATHKFLGTDLAGWTYERPFELVDFPPDSPPTHFVALADYVTTDDGTGLVHNSPAFGPEDMQIARAYELPVVNPIELDGTFRADVPLVGGEFFKHADRALVDDLAARGLLFRHVSYEHAYPHCWRCHTPVIYYALPSWYIRTTAIKDRLLAENERTRWVPESVKWGRYGDWLRNNVDWALSRSRYWGTPLPIWRCVDGHQVCVGSLAELGELAGRPLDDLDPHRPFVDEVSFACPTCGEQAHRVSEVIDAWYDSGSMPFAQWGYPWVPGSDEMFDRAYPAQYICEAIDQTRGWFYSLMAIGTLVFDQTSYENVVCLGLIVAEDGRKMSKHLGNILEPLPLMDQHGADAMRWFMACVGSPWSARRIGHSVLQEIVRKVLLTYWNTAAFQVLYARASDWTPATGGPSAAERPPLDRWLVSETQRLVRDVTAAMEDFDTQRAGSRLSTFIDDLSNWYVRRSRRRFWVADAAALTTLHETLEQLTRLLAPLVPFVTERVWRSLVAPTDDNAPGSVHLADWPNADETLIDDSLAEAVRTARRLVELGRAARAEAKVKTRQPLRRALIPSGAYETLGPDLRAELAAELNVLEVASLGDEGELVRHSIKPNFRSLGKRFGDRTPQVAGAISGLNSAELAHTLRDKGVMSIEVGDHTVMIEPDDVVITEQPREGWSIVNEHGETVALDLELTDDLRRAGLAREAIRQVQEARKNAGYDITDRINLWWKATGDTALALTEHAGLLRDEVLATTVTRGEPPSPDETSPDDTFITESPLLTVWMAKA
jgi:isoleucyl-tRNA synthetase